MAAPVSQQKALVIQNFEGGWATDKKVGQYNSQAYTQAFDFRKSPSQISVLPGLTREDNGVVKDLLQNEVMTDDGTIYALGSGGGFYKRTTSGVWSSEASIGVGTFGLDYRKDTNSIYASTNKAVSLYNQVSTSPAMYMGYYGNSYSQYNNSDNEGFNVSAYQIGSTKTYTPPTSIIENSNNLRYFQSDIEPLNKISLFVVSKGSGDWTLTLHDGLNNVLGTSTVTNANLNNNTFNDFNFTSATHGQVRIYVAPNARTYHIHAVSTVADGTLSTSAANDLSQSDLEVWSDRLVYTNNGLHPIQRFQQFECIGNGNYLSVWEPIDLGINPQVMTSGPQQEWYQHKLVFPMEYEVCGLAVQNEFLVIAAEKTTTTSSTQQSGILFFWDGLSPTYNYFVIIPEGSPYALNEYKNVVEYYAGGDWYSITGPTSDPIKLRSMPESDTEFSSNSSLLQIYPYAATVRRGVHLMAYPSYSTNTSLNFGVYSWGAVDKNFAESFGYSYLISTGTQNYSSSNNLTIGMVKNFGDILHVSWRDTLNGGYGVDVITNSSNPAPLAIWQSLIFDNGYTSRQKMAAWMDCYYDLPDGATIQMAYSINRGAWILDPQKYSNTNLWQGQSNYARFSTTSGSQGRFYEIQMQLIVTCDNIVTQSPVIYLVSLAYDPLINEKLF